jgi:hypothetical protein
MGENRNEYLEEIKRLEAVGVHLRIILQRALNK